MLKFIKSIIIPLCFLLPLSLTAQKIKPKKEVVVIIPNNRYYSLFYIDNKSNLPFDELLVIGDTIYFNLDIYDDNGEVIDKRVVKRRYKIKNFQQEKFTNSKQRIRHFYVFDLLDFISSKKIGKGLLDCSTVNEKGERVCNWEIEWLNIKKIEKIKTSLFVPKMEEVEMLQSDIIIN